MGKTILCKKIVHEVYKNSLWKDLYDRVIWLPLRRLKKIESRTTIELLENEFLCTRLGERISEALGELVRDERTLFLLDGLDEVSLALEQDSTGERVLHELLSQSHVIITSRPHITRILDHQPPELELETVGFFPQQIEEYLQKSQ
jgi:predicted NACHT family NTPase